MSRTSDTERGARLALKYSDAVLAASSEGGLFPLRLSPKRKQLWLSIRRVSLEQLAECQAARDAMKHARQLV